MCWFFLEKKEKDEEVGCLKCGYIFDNLVEYVEGKKLTDFVGEDF